MSYKAKYFKVSEYQCPCGCGLSNIHDNALFFFDRIREVYGKPMIVTSGCRCKEHNIKIGGAKKSPHTPQEDGYTYALDIAIDNSRDRHDFITAAVRVGCNRWAYTKSFVHLDFSPYHDQDVVWVY